MGLDLSQNHLARAQKIILIYQEIKSITFPLRLHACATSAHVPLYTKLVDPFTPNQTLWEFENLIVRTGEADERWIDVAARLKHEKDEEPDEEQAFEMLEIANEFHTECKRVQENLTHPKVSKTSN